MTVFVTLNLREGAKGDAGVGLREQAEQGGDPLIATEKEARGSKGLFLLRHCEAQASGVRSVGNGEFSTRRHV